MRSHDSVVNQATVGLMDTFLKINRVRLMRWPYFKEYYFRNRIQSNVRRKQAYWRCLDFNRSKSDLSNSQYYRYSIDELLNDRYVVKSSIGKVFVIL